MSEQEQLLSYQELLEHLKERGEANHLLLGNGFNNSLGIGTDYESIFNEMVESYPNYKDVKGSLGENYDVELLIKEIKEQTKDEENLFLPLFVENKVKLDFMKAAYSLVSQGVKKVYQDQNEGVYLLLKNFTNYFTLNYDPLLYLLLLKFQNSPNSKAVAFRQQKHFFPNYKEERIERLNRFAKDAYEKGTITTNMGSEEGKLSKICDSTKASFQTFLDNHGNQEAKKYKWTSKEKKDAIDRVLKEVEIMNVKLEFNDGFTAEKNFFKESNNQNLFFLHGCFHIVESKTPKKFKKITQTQNKAFRKKLEEVINSEGKDIVCIFKAKSEEKLNQIQNNAYLKRCFDQLGNISGNLVVFGCSFSENDAHIFNQLQKSSVENLYVSTCKEGLSKTKKAVEGCIQGMNVMYFDYNTVSYKPPSASHNT